MELELEKYTKIHNLKNTFKIQRKLKDNSTQVIEFVSKEIAVELLDALKEAQRVCINQYGKDWETDFKFECDIINEAITNAEK